MVRAVNMGISAIIDPDGRVVALPVRRGGSRKKVERSFAVRCRLIANDTLRTVRRLAAAWRGRSSWEVSSVDPLLGKVAGADGLKTGHTEAAGYGFTGSAEQNGRRLVLVVSGLTSWDERVQESVRFMEWGFNAFEAKPVLAAGKVAARAPVFLGDAADVGLTAAPGATVTVPKAVVGKVSAKIVYDGPIAAPIAKGQKVAELVVQVADIGEQRIPLVAAEAVDKVGPFGRIWAAFKHYVLG